MREVQARAATVVAAVLAGRSLSAELARALGARPALDAASRGQLQDLCYGTLRHLGALRAQRDLLLERPVTEPRLAALLVVALYQLLHTRGAPHAVVDGAVDAAARVGATRARGLVNAVLRNAQRRRAELDEAARATDEARYSLPRWWIDRLRADWPEDWTSILEASAGHPLFSVRVNPADLSRDAFIERCREQGMAATGLPMPDAVRLDKAVPVERLPGFAEGCCSVQDAGAQLAAALLDVRDGERVLDACAAPGGKALHLLQRARVELTAIDVDAARLDRVEQNFHRARVAARLVAADAADLGAWWDGRPFDAILLDAPCSGSGVLRRHPDIRWLRRPDDLPTLARRQRQLLEALWGTLARGGRLLYCTCSVFAIENDGVVAGFLADHDDACRVCCAGHAAALRARGETRLRVNAGGSLDLLPGDDHDGFHYALLSKR
jgi:16S rRNA (cytosine967-C5)-methyltransferase